jgi:hypothetical protein
MVAFVAGVSSAAVFWKHHRASHLCDGQVRVEPARSRQRAFFPKWTASLANVPGSHLQTKESGRSGRVMDEQIAEAGAVTLGLPALGRAAQFFAPALITVQAVGLATAGALKSKRESPSFDSTLVASAQSRHTTSTASFQYTFHTIGSHQELFQDALRTEIGAKLVGTNAHGAAVVARVDPTYVSWMPEPKSSLLDSNDALSARVGGRPELASSHRQEDVHRHCDNADRYDDVISIRYGRRIDRTFCLETHRIETSEAPRSSMCPKTAMLTSPFTAGGMIPAHEEESVRHHRLFIDGQVTDLPPRNASFHGPRAPECFAVRVLRQRLDSTIQFSATSVGDSGKQASTADTIVEDYCIMCTAGNGTMACRSFRASFGRSIDCALSVLACT